MYFGKACSKHYEKIVDWMHRFLFCGLGLTDFVQLEDHCTGIFERTGKLKFHKCQNSML